MKAISDDAMQYSMVNLSLSFLSHFFTGCCIYSKPKLFGDSSSESDSDDDGCPHNAYCTGHKKKGHRGHHHHDHGNKGEGSPGENSEPGGSFST